MVSVAVLPPGVVLVVAGTELDPVELTPRKTSVVVLSPPVDAVLSVVSIVMGPVSVVVTGILVVGDPDVGPSVTVSVELVGPLVVDCVEVDDVVKGIHMHLCSSQGSLRLQYLR